MAGIVRATDVSPRWLQYYVNKKLALVPKVVNVTSKKKGKLRLQCDEMWSFVGSKGNKQWIWLAIDALTKEIVGVYIRSRDELGAKGLWNYLPPVYRQCARSLHRFWASLLDHFSGQKTQSRSKKQWLNKLYRKV